MNISNCGPSHRLISDIATLHYKMEGHRFDSWWGLWDFSLIQSFRSRYGPEFDSVSNRNEYKGNLLGSKGSRCIGLTTLRHSCADRLEILGASTSWSPKGPVQACVRIAWLLALKAALRVWTLGHMPSLGTWHIVYSRILHEAGTVLLGTGYSPWCSVL